MMVIYLQCNRLTTIGGITGLFKFYDTNKFKNDLKLEKSFFGTGKKMFECGILFGI